MTPGRRKSTAKPAVGVRLEKELHDRLRAEADRRDISAAYLVRRAVERMLPVWEGQDLP